MCVATATAAAAAATDTATDTDSDDNDNDDATDAGGADVDAGDSDDDGESCSQCTREHRWQCGRQHSRRSGWGTGARCVSKWLPLPRLMWAAAHSNHFMCRVLTKPQIIQPNLLCLALLTITDAPVDARSLSYLIPI